ncbi:DUF4249 family protein [Aquimarina sp. AU474]|uniref:DUF4249 family protein n=1 Tax=Aquimarina sp. AU474 TaxID=2108529 RepID=UPI000D69115E|nr:DUF4249 family protein [Aquimarina sp. AU474]
MKYYRLLFMILIFSGCTEFVDENIAQPEGKELVLIYGFISPEEDRIKVSVSETRSIFDENLDAYLGTEDGLIIKDAMVTIADENGTTIELIYDDTLKRYIISSSLFAIEPGNKYALRVTAKGKEFTASCTIPVEKVEEINTSLGFRIDEFGQRRENLRVQFDDISGSNNFYIVGAEYKPAGIPDAELGIAFFDLQRFATDVTGDGFPVISNGTVVNINNGLEITTKVAHTDELIYNTLKANFINSRRSDDGDPFFRPIIPPSNIIGEDGYGVFAGFRLTEKQEELSF